MGFSSCLNFIVLLVICEMLVEDFFGFYFDFIGYAVNLIFDC